MVNKIMIFILGALLTIFVYKLGNLQNQVSQNPLSKETTKVTS